MSDITTLAGVKVTIEGDSYSMLAIPDAKSRLVLAERERVLRNIDLDKLVTGLSRTSDLLYLAYNGVAGFGELTGAMTKLHDRFGSLCGKCDIELGNIEKKSGLIQQKLKQVFTFLLKGQEDTAIAFLEQCGAVAKELSDKSRELSHEFDTLGDDTVDVLSKTQIVQGQQLDKKQKLADQTADLKAKTAKAHVLVEKLAEQKKKLEDLYQEAKTKSEVAENRAFALAIVSAVLKPIGEGIGVFGAMYSGGAVKSVANNASLPPSVPPPPSKAGAEKEAADKKEAQEKAESDHAQTTTAAKEKKARQLEAEKLAAEKEESAKKAKEAASAEKDADKKAGLTAQAEIAALAARQAGEKAEIARKEADNAEKAAQETAEKVKVAQAAAEAAKEALAKAGAALEKMEDSYAKIAAEYGREKTEYLKMLMEKQDMERDALSSIAEYAERVKSLGSEVQSVDLTCSSLFHAIGALKQVSVVLRLASHFWSNMAAACEDLARDDLKQIVAGYKLLEKDERLAYFSSDDDFKAQVVRYYAGWKAIEVVSKEYAATASAIMTKVHNDFKQNPEIEAARRLAVQLGEKLLKVTAEDMTANLKERHEIEKALEEQKAA